MHRQNHVGLTGCHVGAEGAVPRHLLPPFLLRLRGWVIDLPHRRHPLGQGARRPQDVTPQTTPTAHPKGTGVAPTGTRSHARASHFPMRGASPLQPAMNDPPGFQADPPLTLSPLRWGSGYGGGMTA